MRRLRERDFIAFYNALWYRDFPIIREHEQAGRRAGWTTHIASIVKQIGDLMGLFTCFESGRRTDAEIQLISGVGTRRTWAKVEWEWQEAVRPNVNEFEKLAEACQEPEENGPDIAIFIGYCKRGQLADLKQQIATVWKSVQKPLLCFIVDFDGLFNKRRNFVELHTIRFSQGRGGNLTIRDLRSEQALPWKVEGTKWWGAATAKSNLGQHGPSTE